MSPYLGIDGPDELLGWKTNPDTLNHVICFGDSVTQGLAIDSKTASFVDTLRTSIGTWLGAEVHDGFQPILWRSNMGGFATPVRYSSSAGWTDVGDLAVNLGPSGQVQAAIRSNNNTLRSVTWTRPAAVSVTTVTFWWVDDVNVSSGAKWSYSTDGGTVWTEVATASPASPELKTTTVTGLSNPTDVRFRNADAAGTTFNVSPAFLGIDVRDGDEGWVVHNMGQVGAALSNATVGAVGASRAGDWRPVFDALAPRLVIFEMSNDDLGYDAGAYATAIDTFCDHLTCDLVAYGFADQIRLIGGSNLAAVRTAYQDRIAADGGLVVDMGIQWGPNLQAQVAGRMPVSANNSVHPTAAGDLEVAAALMLGLKAHSA